MSARLGRRQPVAPIINTMIQYGPPASQNQGQAVVVTGISVTESARRHHVRDRDYIIIRQLLSGAVIAPPIGKISKTTHESSRRRAYRAADIYTPFIQTIRPPDPVQIPCLVQTDPKAQPRTREHIDLVSTILNSLIMQRELIREPGQQARGDWKLGYVPAITGNWSNPAPKTIKDALDRVAGGLVRVDGGTWP